jgi:hypothetical protein
LGQPGANVVHCIIARNIGFAVPATLCVPVTHGRSCTAAFSARAAGFEAATGFEAAAAPEAGYVAPEAFGDKF